MLSLFNLTLIARAFMVCAFCYGFVKAVEFFLNGELIKEVLVMLHKKLVGLGEFL